MQVVYAIAWTIIFGVIASFLTAANSGVLNFLGYVVWVLCGLSVATLFRMMGR